MSDTRLDLVEVQKRLATTQGRHYWRSLEELAETSEFQEFLHREFPRQASEWLPSMSRRNFLQLMGASLALAGLTACSSPPEKIVPYVQAPENEIPGQSLFFATAYQLGGYAKGVLAQSQLNRPTKLEGNPDHPASLGATDALTQASILNLYDPDRAKEVTQKGTASTWEDFLSALKAQVAGQQSKGGSGLHILTETVTSPTLLGQLQAIQSAFPKATWHQYEPVNRDNVYAGARLAFGEAVEPLYHFDQADVIVSLDADFLVSMPGSVRFARDFADGRRVDRPAERKQNRLYAIESTPTLTGANADHRLALRAGQIDGFARALANAVSVGVQSSDDGAIPANWISAISKDLQAHKGTSLVVVGDHQPSVVHALAHAINEKLGNVGKTVTYADPVVNNTQSQSESLQALSAALKANQVELLLILGANPVYSAPVDLEFASLLAQVAFSAYLGGFVDETGAQCQWQIPESHYLESWSDARAYDGTVTIQQPLIEPLYASHSAHELLDALLTETPRSDHDIVKEYWGKQPGAENLDLFWRQALHDGLVANSALPAKTVSVKTDWSQQAAPASSSDLEINFRPDPTVWDGRFANNGWLQELPKPLTKLTWENAALISPTTAAALGVDNGDMVELSLEERTVQAPIWLLPGHAENSITLHLGYGRTQAGRVGTSLGVNAYVLRGVNSLWFAGGVGVRKVSSGYRLATTQDHQSMEGRNLIRSGTFDEFASNPTFAQEVDGHGEEISLYPKFDYTENAWGMAIDLSACIGCNACVTACQAENNIPIVGKEQVLNGREMHWIRLDRYFEGEVENPDIYHQPVLCMHCENAPCEVVCPVAATMHDSEGLNTMVYNRCVGTRYCSNNCPYKVRRFNFLEFADYEDESLKLQRNPNVTVRARGVMEKCTYCVQRISAARINAKLEDRTIADGEVVTACQAACPTKAIVFGNINDASSDVAKRKASPLNYGLLTDLNTHPRTTYLAKLRNPNPELQG
ncbi:MAG: TAT-variant-translocated molybdopterin oxidoreductase [Caldilineaceae bacterium]